MRHTAKMNDNIFARTNFATRRRAWIMWIYPIDTSIRISNAINYLKTRYLQCHNDLSIIANRIRDFKNIRKFSRQISWCLWWVFTFYHFVNFVWTFPLHILTFVFGICLVTFKSIGFVFWMPSMHSFNQSFGL